MPLAPAPSRPRPFLTESDAEFLTVGLSMAVACILGGVMLAEFPRSQMRPRLKPQPERRVTIYDLTTGQAFLVDRPYVREERYDRDRYFFRFKDGSERFLDLAGHDYRIIRREV